MGLGLRVEGLGLRVKAKGDIILVQIRYGYCCCLRFFLVWFPARSWLL